MSLVVVSLGSGLAGAEIESSEEEVRSAIKKSIPLLEKTTIGTSEHRGCFTCHGHAMPVVALVEARRRGFVIDENNIREQLEHTLADLKVGKERYLDGRGQGGGFTRAGYALWMLQEAGWKPDEITGIVSGYLVRDEKADHWKSNTNRPPTEFSPFTATYLALEAIDQFGTEEQALRIADRQKKAREWLLQTKPRETEERVFQILGLGQLGASEKAAEAAGNLLQLQRSDGGWAQLPGKSQQSDPYATGSVLFALRREGFLTVMDKRFRRGLRFLIDTQNDDGSWHVKSRSKPFQKYYESGYPHGKDQFISMAAGSWATLALLQSAIVEKNP